MYSAFRNVDDALRKEAVCAAELDYAEQISWQLFLKYFDRLEQDRATETQLEGKKCAYILEKPYRWDTLTAPRDASGQIDHNRALSGDDLCDFVNRELLPYLQKCKERATGLGAVGRDTENH